jgi:GH43 family beta-xylosidase
MIITNVTGLRDPFMLLDNGVYYFYGTGANVWDCYVNDSGSLNGEWKRIENPVYEKPQNAVKQFWAPEVHKYDDSFLITCFCDGFGFPK